MSVDHKKQNTRLGLILASVAAVFFLGLRRQNLAARWLIG